MVFHRALFIRFGGLGDILLATPTLRAVAHAFPGIELDFVVASGTGDTLSGHPLLRRLLCFDKAEDVRPARFARFLGDLRRQRYDLVVNLHPSAKSYLMAGATGARTHLTFRKRMQVNPSTGRVVHAVDDFSKELRPLGITAVTDRRLDFSVPDAARFRVEDLLTERGILPRDRILVINPAATRALNRWPVERFGAVAAYFAGQPHVAVIITGASGDTALAAQVARTDPRVRDFSGLLTVKELGALLARADSMLTCDTGPMHIGAALETPLVVLSGAADPDRTGPLTGNSTVLIDRALPCVPCRDRVCARGDVMCMQNISLAAVTEAVEQRLAGARRGRTGYALPVIT